MSTQGFAAIAALVTGVLLVACGGDDGAGSPSEATGYDVEFQSHNFVLPQWGGIDAATLTVNDAGTAAFGELDRTGDGRYEVVFVDRETFFRRTTCDHFARIPGGGPDVLRPFLSPLEVYPARTGTGVAIGGFGTGDVETDRDGRATRITGLTVAGEAFEISFSNWGVDATISKPDGVTGDQGPGGNPC